MIRCNTNTPCISRVLQVLLACVLLAIHLPALAAFQATVDRNRISLQDSLELTLVSTEGNPSDIDFSPLEVFFDIARESSGTSVNIINGSMTTTRTVTLLLLPKQSGDFLIPGFEISGEKSQPIQVRVGGAVASNDPNNTAALARVELTADIDTARIQQQIFITLKLSYLSNKFIKGSLADIEPPNGILLKLGESDRQENKNGILWQILERRYAVYPQKSGQLIIPPIRFEGILNDGRRNSFFQSGRPHTVRSNALQFTIQGPAYTDAHWLPAQNLTVTSKLDQQQTRVGEPVTRTIEIRARGQVGEQLPLIPIPQTSGLKMYQDKAEINNQIISTGVDGLRTETLVVIPEREGTLTIPEQQLSWWDVRSQQRKKLVIPEHSLVVLPAAFSPIQQIDPTVPQAVTGTPITTTQSTTGLPNWIDITLLSLLLCSLLANVYLWKRKSAIKSDEEEVANDENQAFQLLSKRINNLSPESWQRSVNLWLQQMGELPCLSIRQLMSLLQPFCQDDELEQFTTWRQQLEDWVYNEAAKPDMDILLKLCQRLRKNHGYPRSYAIPGFSLENN